MLTFKNIQKHYENVVGIENLNLNIEKGELVVVVGPSGCGKSTFLRLVAGLEPITSGDLFMNGKRINDVRASQRNMAMVFQNYALYPHMSVFDNIAYGLKIRGIHKKLIQERVSNAADMLQLTPYLKRKPKALSGGQRQRVAMARALVREPEVFLFDEPLSNLDAKLRVETRLKIHKLQRRLGITSIYVTHDQVEAMTLADKLVVMNAGRVEQIGTPLDIYHHPATQFVAGFIGSPAMNFINVEIDKNKLTFGKHLLHIENTLNINKAVLGVRPDNFELCDTPDDNTFPGKIDMIEALGNEFILFIKVDGLKNDLVLRFNKELHCHEGQTLNIRMKTEALHFFDVVSGERTAATCLQ